MCEAEQGRSIYRSSALSRYVSSLIVDASETSTPVFFTSTLARLYFDTQYRLSTSCTSRDMTHFHESLIPHPSAVFPFSTVFRSSLIALSSATTCRGAAVFIAYLLTSKSDHLPPLKSLSSFYLFRTITRNYNGLFVDGPNL